MEEPHDYTISFFQFDPTDIGVEKKESKKDIKPSDIYSNKNISHANKNISHANKNISHANDALLHNKNSTLNSTKIDGKKMAAKIAEGLTKNSSQLHLEKKKITEKPIKRKFVPSSNFDSFFENDRNFYRSDVLNPNPRPSVELALHNLHLPKSNVVKKPIVLYTANHTTSEKSHNSLIKITKNIMLKQENTSHFYGSKAPLAKQRDIDHVFLKNATSSLFKKSANSLLLIAHLKSNATNNTKHSNYSKESVEPKKHNFSKMAPATKNDKSNVDKKAQLSKLEKDKKVNKEILEAAKKIVPVKNTVKTSPIHIKNESFSQAAELQKRNMTSQIMLVNDNSLSHSMYKANEELEKVNHIVAEYSHVGIDKSINDFHPKTPVDEIDEFRSSISKHREKVSKFVPLYKTIGKKDRAMSFQRGLLKHPEHKMYPKCHQCPQNSTYAQCVKSSTLFDCNKGLNNICFTRSTKKYGKISYEMGCADHKQCNDAKAFPCKGLSLFRGFLKKY